MADPLGREVDRVSVRVLPNLRRFLPDLQKYLKRIETQVRVELPTSLDTSGLEEEARRAARAVEQSTEINLPVDVDTGAAEAQIARATRPRTVPVDVDVDRSSLRLLTSGLDSAVSAVGSIGKFGGIGLLGGGGVVAVTGLTIAAIQAAGAVGVLGAAMISAGGAAGILGLAIGGQVVEMAKQQQDIKTAADALAKLEPGTKEYRDKLVELTALQHTFNQQFGPAATALAELKTAWTGFLDATRTNTLDLMAGSLDTITGILPQLAPAANHAARAVGRLVDEFARWTRGSGFAAFLDWIETNGIKTMTRFARAFGNVALAFGPIIAAFTPFANQMMRGLLGLSRQFRDFIDQAAKSGALHDFAATGVAAFKSLAGLVGDVAGSLISIGKAAAAATGGGILGGLGSVFDRLHDFLASPAAQKAMTAFFSGVNKGFAALGQAMGPVGKALETVLPALGSILSSVGAGLGAALEAIAKPLGILAKPLSEVAGLLSNALVAALQALTPALGKLASGLGKALVDLVEGLAPQIPSLARAFGKLAITLANTLVPALPGLVKGLIKIFPVIPALLRSMANLLPVITPLLKAVADRLPELAHNAVQLMKALLPVTAAARGLAGPLRHIIDVMAPYVDAFIRVERVIRGFVFKVLKGLLIGALQLTRDQLGFIADILTGDFSGAWGHILNMFKRVVGWLDSANQQLHDWLVKLDSLPGIEIPGLGNPDFQQPKMGPLDHTAPHGPSAPQFNFNVQAHDYNDFRRQTARRVRHANAGGVAFAP